MQEAQTLSKYVLAIDLGTGGPKVGLVSQEGRVLSSAFAPVQLSFLPGGGAEHDPAEWWSTIKDCVRQVLVTSRVPPEAIIAIGVTSMWSVTLPVDQDGEPLMNVVSWMDERGGPYNRELMKGFPSVQGYKLSLLLKYLDLVGFPPTPRGADALGHMLFIKHERPEVYRRTYKFLEPMDYINMRLTGKFAATQNTALPMMMTDNRRLNVQEYHPWLLKRGGIEREKLPDLLPIDGILGTITPAVARELGLSPTTVVICGVNDNSTSAIGAGSIADAEPAAVLGTSGYLAAHVPFKKTDINASMGTMPSGLKDRYLFWGELLNNGKVLVAGGYSAILLGVTHQVIDVWGWKAWATIFVWIGANAITLYFINGVAGFQPFALRFVGGDVSAWLNRVVTPGTGFFVAHLLGLVFAIALAGFLYRRKIFLRV